MEEDLTSSGGTDDQLVPTEVKFVDFQSARFASLATDLNLFLFTSVQVIHLVLMEVRIFLAEKTRSDPFCSLNRPQNTVNARPV